jgi:hypothetical protein
VVAVSLPSLPGRNCSGFISNFVEERVQTIVRKI